MSRRIYVVAVVVALVGLIAAARVVLTYRNTPQAFDEPVHISAGLEWVDRGTYTLDPVHPPLSRVAIGLPLYVAGERFPGPDRIDPNSPDGSNTYAVGNHILYDDGHYVRNLALARLGVLPFLMLGTLLVFLWARREFGDLAGVMAAALFTTLPVVLAFSGLAYTDLPTACMQFAALFAFTGWLERPGGRSSLVLGAAVGLALLSKMTSLIFLPAAAVGIVFCKFLVRRHQEAGRSAKRSKWIANLCISAVVAVMVVWGGYNFSVGHVREAFGIRPEAMPSFQHFPGPLRSVAKKLILSDPAIPASAFVNGVATAWVLNQSAPPAYLLGKVRDGGWWYFFLVAAGVKTPTAFLVLSLVGLFPLAKLVRVKRWSALAPAVAAVAVLLVTTSVKYDAGLRHIMVIFPLLSVVGGCGAAYLWQLPGNRRMAGRAVLAGLLLWQGMASFGARHDYIAYFTEFAGRDPSEVLVGGCDLDCGQDVYRLAQVLKEKQVSQFHIAIWSSANLSHLGFPAFERLEPFQPVTGWVAISMRALRFGDSFHDIYPPNAYAWLNAYQPVAQVGKSIRLYYIPAKSETSPAVQLP